MTWETRYRDNITSKEMSREEESRVDLRHILGLPIRVAKLETSIQFQSWEKLWARDMFIVTYISILTTDVSIVLLVLIKSSKIFENTTCFPKSWNNEISENKVLGLSFGHSQHLQIIIPQET